MEAETLVKTCLEVSRKIDLWRPSNGMIVEIGRAESLLGTHPLTWREGYFGGPWQVDLAGWKATRDTASHPRLHTHHTSLEVTFGIRWKWVRWEECRHPFISALAARLLLLSIPDPIPSDMEGRAKYWKKWYNTEAGKGTVEHYLEVNNGGTV